MAYWWVSQNKTFREELAGGYLWAPITDKRGTELHHHRAMVELREGDIVFSYVNQTVAAISTVAKRAFHAQQPAEFGRNTDWDREGRMAYVHYRQLEEPVPLHAFLQKIQPYLPETRSPITRAGTGAQGYLFALPPRAGRVILERIEGANDWMVPAEAVERTAPTETQRAALVQSRVGQGAFRRDVLAVWGHQCAATGLSNPILLRASHIKPWADSNNEERLDRCNGLSLAVNYDAAFDAGLLTFQRDGRLELSPQFPANQAALLGIDPSVRIDGLVQRHREFLEYHHAHVFKAHASPTAS